MNIGVLNVTEDHSKNNTGITAVVNLLTGWYADFVKGCATVGILATGKDSESAQAGVQLFEVSIPLWCRLWRWSPGLAKRLETLVSSDDIRVLHLHGLWRAAPWVAQRIANKYGIPTVLTVHGMVEPWTWTGQGWLHAWKKNLYWRLIARPVFRQVSILHAITPLERDHLSALMPGKRIEVIPNAVDLREIDRLTEGIVETPQRIILYLGRIHPKKGIDILISAFASAELGKKWRLVIAGPVEDEKYWVRLQQLVNSLGSDLCIDFIGPVYGKEKYRWIKRAWVMAVPSFSEVVGLVNLEAAACGIPTVTTFQTGLLNWEEGGGLLVEPHVSALSQALKQVGCWDIKERENRGRNSRELVEKQYSLATVGRQWAGLYEELACKRIAAGNLAVAE